MKESIYSIIEKIEKLSDEINKAKAYISEEQEAYAKKVFGPNNMIIRAEAELETLKNMTITATVGDIQTAIAEVWGVARDEVSVSLSTNFMATSYNEPSEESAKETIKIGLESYHKYSLLFTEDNGKKRPFRFESYSNHIDYKEVGGMVKPIISEENEYGAHDIFFGVEDLSKMPVTFKIKDFIGYYDNLVHPTNNKTKAFFMASEIYRLSHEKEELSK